MTKSSQYLYTAEQVRSIDQEAIKTIGDDGFQLMSQAGLTVFRYLRWRWPRAKRLTIVCGPGNNGGDGYIVARLAIKAGLDISVVADTKPGSSAAVRAYDAFIEVGGSAVSESDPIESADLIVDALLGTGLTRNVQGVYAEYISAMNSSSRPVLAVDVPSGLNSDNGAIHGEAVRASATVSFIGKKIGCYVGEGPLVCGERYFSDLGVTVSKDREYAAQLIHADPGFLDRSATVHKGKLGRVLVIGGNSGMAGAVSLSARACHRSGAGLVSILSPQRSDLSFLSTTPETMLFSGSLKQPTVNFDVIAIGPGLGQDDWAQQQLSAALETSLPLVVDADALNLLSRQPQRRDNWVLTPHPGEAARLLNCSVTQVQSDRPAAITALQQKYGGVVVLKGAGSLIRGEQLWVCDRGNPGMASAGMGDALTGLIAGFIGQGMTLERASALAVWCHAGAADLAFGDYGIGLNATDVIEAFGKIIDNPAL